MCGVYFILLFGNRKNGVRSEAETVVGNTEDMLFISKEITGLGKRQPGNAQDAHS